jgi:hypothetical protein
MLKKIVEIDVYLLVLGSYTIPAKPSKLFHYAFDSLLNGKKN